ncbi:uncharacterized protein B0H18DRAFT_1001887 [Fomitopsis serialis]|uniref:uncharacterized protein n=1 Tax=Fomitopsis serialis TaxID=139415 RepID=UPI00200895F9|nr:uncharacterized protein B0H18DRAFT_1001887 [Neoantrodia serialis]KAH9927712.1 hypothetical protein B0H18DRAFT_1001887 [Neoantrodia serialis]
MVGQGPVATQEPSVRQARKDRYSQDECYTDLSTSRGSVRAVEVKKIYGDGSYYRRTVRTIARAGEPCHIRPPATPSQYIASDRMEREGWTASVESRAATNEIQASSQDDTCRRQRRERTGYRDTSGRRVAGRDSERELREEHEEATQTWVCASTSDIAAEYRRVAVMGSKQAAEGTASEPRYREHERGTQHRGNHGDRRTEDGSEKTDSQTAPSVSLETDPCRRERGETNGFVESTRREGEEADCQDVQRQGADQTRVGENGHASRLRTGNGSMWIFGLQEARYKTADREDARARDIDASLSEEAEQGGREPRATTAEVHGSGLARFTIGVLASRVADRIRATSYSFRSHRGSNRFARITISRHALQGAMGGIRAIVGGGRHTRGPVQLRGNEERRETTQRRIKWNEGLRLEHGRTEAGEDPDLPKASTNSSAHDEERSRATDVQRTDRAGCVRKKVDCKTREAVEARAQAEGSMRTHRAASKCSEGEEDCESAVADGRETGLHANLVAISQQAGPFEDEAGVPAQQSTIGRTIPACSETSGMMTRARPVSSDVPLRRNEAERGDVCAESMQCCGASLELRPGGPGATSQRFSCGGSVPTTRPLGPANRRLSLGTNSDTGGKHAERQGTDEYMQGSEVPWRGHATESGVHAQTSGDYSRSTTDRTAISCWDEGGASGADDLVMDDGDSEEVAARGAVSEPAVSWNQEAYTGNALRRTSLQTRTAIRSSSRAMRL